MMALSLIQFIFSAGIIVVAGIVITQCADTISEKTKLGRLVVGSIFLAGATSLPELSVDLSAVRMGLPDMAVGDLMGSSLFNLKLRLQSPIRNPQTNWVEFIKGSLRGHRQLKTTPNTSE